MVVLAAMSTVYILAVVVVVMVVESWVDVMSMVDVVVMAKGGGGRSPGRHR